MIKKILLTIMILIFTSSLVFAGWDPINDIKHPEKGWIKPADDQFFGLDKFEHFAGGIGGQTAFHWFYNQVFPKVSANWARPMAFVSTFTLGLAKEVYFDGKRDGASYVDLAWMIGGQAISMAFFTPQPKGAKLIVSVGPQPKGEFFKLTYKF